MRVKSFQLIRPTIECIDCGWIGKGKRRSRLNGCVFFLLLMLGIIPGLIYLVWADSQQYWYCRDCDSDRVKPYRGVKK